MWLSDLAIKRPAFTTVVTLLLMVVGAMGYMRLSVDFLPDADVPVFSIAVPYPGASPEQVEEQVVQPIEDQLASISGLADLYSYSREHVGIIVAAFDMGTDVALVSDEVRDAFYMARTELPEGVQDPIFTRFDPSAVPVMTWAVSTRLSPLETRTLVDEVVKPAVENIEGVGTIRIQGGEQREIQLELDLPKMAALRIPFMRVLQQVGYDIADIPGGNLEAGATRYSLRAKGSVDDLGELGDIMVQPLPSPIYLRDIATVVDGTVEQRTVSRVGGWRAVTFDVIKEGGANSTAVCEEVHATMDELAGELPTGTVMFPVLDYSIIVDDMAHEMRLALILGALFAVLVVYVFMLDWRSTLISAVALPTSVVTTFFFMWMAGFSMNVLSLLALSLAIGILIDDAVVVIEVIYRHMEAGEDALTAARNGTKEVGLAVMATTLTILAVFLPVGFVGGMIGQFFKQFGLTVGIAVAVSLFIAFTVTPMLASRYGKLPDRSRAGMFGRLQARVMTGIEHTYRDVLRWSLDHGRLVVGTAVALFVGSLLLISVVGFEFLPDYDRSRFEVDVRTSPATTLAAAEQQAIEVEQLLLDIEEVEDIYTVVGPDGETDWIHMTVLLPDKSDRRRSVYEVMDEAREALAVLPGVTTSVVDLPIVSGGMLGKAIEIEVRGEQPDQIEQVATDIRLGLQQIPGTTGIETTYRPGKPELRLDVDRGRAGMAGLSVGQIGITSRLAVAGQVVGTFREGERTHDIRIRAREIDRTPRALMPNLLLLSPLPRPEDPHGQGTPVALQNVASLAYRTAPAVVTRHDRQRYLKVSCDLAGRPLSDVRQDAQAMIDGLGVPAGVDVMILGDVELMEDAAGSLSVALVLAVVFIFVVLVSQFESFVHPFTIMLSLPLAVVGAFLTLLLFGWSVGVIPMLGIILLLGLVTKNAILLVDRANQFRAEGVSIRESLIRAGGLRLRPILMTTFAMILGMLPPALSTGSGSELRQPMAWPVIGGLVASTLLTLVVVPVVYAWIEGLREKLGTRKEASP